MMRDSVAATDSNHDRDRLITARSKRRLVCGDEPSPGATTQIWCQKSKTTRQCSIKSPVPSNRTGLWQCKGPYGQVSESRKEKCNERFIYLTEVSHVNSRITTGTVKKTKRPIHDPPATEASRAGCGGRSTLALRDLLCGANHRICCTLHAQASCPWCSGEINAWRLNIEQLPATTMITAGW